MHMSWYVITIFLFFIPCVHAMDNPFNMLPLELHGRIIKTVLNLIIHEDNRSRKATDQKKLKKHHLHMPIALGIQFTQEFSQLQKICQKEIGRKKFLAQELFILPREQKDVFVRMANRSNFRTDFEGNIDNADLMTLIAIEDENIKKGLDLHVAKGGKCYYVGMITMIMLCSPFLIMPIFDPTNYLHTWIATLAGCSFLGSIPLACMCAFVKDMYMCDDYYFYNDDGQLVHYSSRKGKIKKLTL